MAADSLETIEKEKSNEGQKGREIERERKWMEMKEKVVKKAPCEQPIIDGKYYWQLEFVGEALLSMERGPMVLSGWSTTSGEHVDAGEHQYSPQWMVLASQPTTR